jgi:hypothetical protein
MARRRRQGENVRGLQALMDAHEAMRTPIPHVNFIDGCEDYPKRMLLGPTGDLLGEGAARDPAHANAIRLFLLQLAINHTVVIEKVLDRNTREVVGSQLSASSPDEEAFVLAADHFGMKFFKRHKCVDIGCIALCPMFLLLTLPVFFSYLQGHGDTRNQRRAVFVSSGVHITVYTGARPRMRK